LGKVDLLYCFTWIDSYLPEPFFICLTEIMGKTFAYKKLRDEVEAPSIKQNLTSSFQNPTEKKKVGESSSSLIPTIIPLDSPIVGSLGVERTPIEVAPLKVSPTAKSQSEQTMPSSKSTTPLSKTSALVGQTSQGTPRPTSIPRSCHRNLPRIMSHVNEHPITRVDHLTMTYANSNSYWHVNMRNNHI